MPAVYFLTSWIVSLQKSKKYKQEITQLQDKIQVLEAKEEQLKLERDSVK